VEWLSGKAVELGLALPQWQGSWQAGGCGCLVPGWCLSQRGGALVFYMELQPGRASWAWETQGVVVRLSRVAGVQQGLKGGELGGGGWYPGKLWVWLQAGVWHRLVVGIPVVMDRAPRGRHSSMVEAGLAQGRESRSMWVWHRAMAWHSLKGGEPGRTEQQLCRPQSDLSSASWQGLWVRSSSGLQLCFHRHLDLLLYPFNICTHAYNLSS
jgi:hypothetical protein